jgi:hypothetical protein
MVYFAFIKYHLIHVFKEKRKIMIKIIYLWGMFLDSLTLVHTTEVFIKTSVNSEAGLRGGKDV